MCDLEQAAQMGRFVFGCFNNTSNTTYRLLLAEMKQRDALCDIAKKGISSDDCSTQKEALTQLVAISDYWRESENVVKTEIKMFSSKGNKKKYREAEEFLAKQATGDDLQLCQYIGEADRRIELDEQQQEQKRLELELSREPEQDLSKENGEVSADKVVDISQEIDAIDTLCDKIESDLHDMLLQRSLTKGEQAEIDNLERVANMRISA
jgi:hypothetical protein